MNRLSMRQHIAAVIGSFIALGVVNSILNASFEASNHPVSYAEGQTTFSGDEVKGYYAVMEEAETLSIYVRTQLIDFGFIAAMALFGICLGTLLARANAEGSIGRRAGRLSANAIVVGSLFDVAENLVSFVMLAQPQTFPGWMAIAYSSFAVAKFAFVTLAILAAVVSAAAWIIARIRHAIDRE